MSAADCYFDFHSHRPPSGDTVALVSVPSLPAVSGCYSLMLHPWQLPETFAGLSPDWLEQAGQAVAVGEIGLDRLKGPELAVQMHYLEAALAAAAERHKPAVFHCVRCRSELFSLTRHYPAMPKLIHGFDGGLKALHEYWAEGFLVSLGHRGLAREELRPVLSQLENWRRLGLESDDEPGGVGELYCRAAELTGTDVRPVLQRNFRNFLGENG